MTGKGLKITYLLVLAMLLGIFSGSVFALDVTEVDFSAHGSVSLTLREMDTLDVVEDVTFALYRIAGLTPDGYEKSVGFAGYERDIMDFDSEDLIPSLMEYIRENQIDCYKLQNAGKSGEILFEDLPLGLYLLVQTSDTATHRAAKPFLVSVPMTDPTEDVLIYDVDASPKVGTVTKVTPTPPPTPPTTPPPRLPQTGMLMWPVPVLAGCGLILFVTGWVVRRRTYDED